jgi:hypothetical protein
LFLIFIILFYLTNWGMLEPFRKHGRVFPDNKGVFTCIRANLLPMPLFFLFYS